ncbi:hypothetical protein [Oleispirillum naphthae]|uniref:hypothetical protein n=1 Tax=Oleispirillum naphthae TaxID=2838853 RepID=UPI00308258ED
MNNNSVTPPPPMPPPAARAGAAAAVVTLSSPQIAALPRGTPLEARILAVAADGAAQVSATLPDGSTVTVEARLPLPLPEGAELLLRTAQAAGDAATLRLAAVNGLPLARVLADPAFALKSAASAAPAQGAAAAQEASAAPAASTIGVGRPVPALVLRGDVMQDAAAQGAPLTLVPGTRLSVRLTRISLPETAPPAAPAGAAAAPGGAPAASDAAARYAAMGRIGRGAPSAVPGAPPPATPGLAAAAAPPSSGAVPAAPGASAARNPAAPNPAAPPQSALPGLGAASGAAAHPGAPPAGAGPAAARPLQTPAAAPPDPAAAPAPAPAAASGAALPVTLSGVVISRSSLGQPTLRTEAGFIALDVRAPLPNGTQVRFDVLSAVPADAAPPPALPGAASPWATLDALMQTLSRAAPAAAADLAARLPQPGPQMLANLAAAVAAVRAGNADAWLGLPEIARRADDREAGRAGKLAARLADEVRDGAQAARRPAGEWRAYALPFVVGGAVERIHMLVRRAPDREDAEEEAERRRSPRRDDTRFLLDISLSRLGPMQIDGLVNAAVKSLDVVIRTHAALPAQMPAELRGLFVETLGAVGYTGSLGFAVTPRFVTPEDAGDTPGGPGLVV